MLKEVHNRQDHEKGAHEASILHIAHLLHEASLHRKENTSQAGENKQVKRHKK